MLAGAKLCPPCDVERELDREVDSVRFPGVSSDRLYEGVVVIRPNLVAAIAVQGLASEHVATDTAMGQLEPR